MQELIAKFEHLYIHRDSLDSDVAVRLRSLFPGERVSVVESPPHKSGELSAREFARSKRLLYIAPFKGQFFKRCPGSRPGLSCCNYFVLSWGLQCDMNCSYCYLQSFINTPVLTIYSNLEEALAELRAFRDLPSLRVGTGETVDSLSLDPLTLYSHRLIEFFREFPQWTLEFKTKSAAVDQFLDVPHAGNVITSWSVNPQTVISAEEHGTASLDQRLSAAERCRVRGFRISFHIDPMIWHPEWEQSYAELVDEIAGRFKPADVPYMSVGALRFQPEQRAMMRERFGLKSYVTQAEVFPSADGKLRYDRSLRQRMFRFVFERFQQHDPGWRIFMCMESPETWLSTTGQSPFKQGHLHDLFDPKVVRAAAAISPSL
jgi:spore photoproduct lyase